MSKNDMIKQKKDWNETQKSHAKFNSVTHKSEPENQNQTNNVRQEGISKINQNR